ncbi:MAG TPA: HYExAFE family protein, partial [Planctomycetota bacterium]|nr:HYExAFE family protein [Planctomycetota bacterium]
LRRAADREGPIKNFDFLVHCGPRHFIVDVKGKRFPQVSRGKESYWENWIHYADLEGLFAWENHFGEGYEGLLVYCYWLQVGADDAAVKKTVSLDGRDYLLVGIGAKRFAEHCRKRSARWQALSIPEKTFTSLIRPIERLLPVETS